MDNNMSNTVPEKRIKNVNKGIQAVETTDELFAYAKHLDCRELHIDMDPETGLHAIIAIHSTALGPAFGGCRCIEYPDTNAAIIDAIRLARGMSYKSAMYNIPHGGGKTVLIKPRHIEDRAAYFKSLGRFIHSLGGRYITAKDSGTTVEDMDLIASETPYVGTTSTNNNGDPSPYTALSVMKGIKASVFHLYQRKDIENLHVAIQGAGCVGYHLAKLLFEGGAKLSVCDINLNNAVRIAEEFKAKIVTPDEIYKQECDIFSPCALGATLNEETIPQLKAKIIAGSANNQLAQNKHAELLKKHNILYAPDYVINCGGLIHATYQYHKISTETLKEKINETYQTLLDIYHRAEEEKKPTHEIADNIAEKRIAKRSKPDG